MGIFDGILGGQGGLTHTTTTNNTTTATNPAQQAGGWAVLTSHPQALQNSTLMNNPNTWAQSALTPYGETMELKKEVEALRYILQRTVENYDELMEQHKALQDIANAERNAR
jgi:hypothetical protein